jgi:sialic acid synthase SpsE
MIQRVRQWEAPIKNYGCQCGASIILEELEAEYGKERVQAVLGTGIKKLAPAERANYGRTNRSIHVMHDMKKGDYITPDSIAILRTEKILEPGLDPKYVFQIIGARLSQDITAGQGLLWYHLLDVPTSC